MAYTHKNQKDCAAVVVKEGENSVSGDEDNREEGGPSTSGVGDDSNAGVGGADARVGEEGASLGGDRGCIVMVGFCESKEVYLLQGHDI